jgi:hypothetical protein
MRAMADDRERRLRAKNLALLWVLLGVVALFFVMTLVKMGGF